MPVALVADLRGQLAAHQAVVVAGAGVAAAASGGRPEASWAGLLRAGIAFCEANVPALPADWLDAARKLTGLGDTSSLIIVAEMVTERLGGRDGGEYSRFLRETFEHLPLTDPAVPQALVALGVPVATTNYDSLLEKASGLDTITWRDTRRFERVLRGEEAAIAHLHGHWLNPPSVVLGIRSYEAALGDAGSQGLQRAMATVRSLVFVGVGAGVGDPNWTALRAWLALAFPGTEYRHYRLCRTGEEADVAAEHRNERILPVAYGELHSDLAPFLRNLTLNRPPERAVVAAPRGLPGPRPTQGRHAEVLTIVANLLSGPPVPTVVLGAPGIGKTNLTLAALHDRVVAGRYGKRRYFVRCEGAASAQAVMAEIAAAVGLSGIADPTDAVLTRLADDATAVVLDNADSAWENEGLATEEMFGALASTGIGLVVSLRGAERPGGVGWKTVLVGPLETADARALFLSIAGPEFDQPSLDELIAEMGGIPLALELLAHVAEGEANLDDLVRRWRNERVSLLKRQKGGNRLLSVAVSVETSWASGLVTDADRRLLALMGWLPDGISRGDLDDLLPGEGAGAANSLRRRALAFDEGRRLRTHPPIRHYMADAHPPTSSDWQRAVEHYVALVEKHGRRVGGSGGAEAAARLLAESANLEAALLAALTAPDPRRALRAVDGLATFASFTGVDVRPVLKAAVVASGRVGEAGLQADAIEALALVDLARSDHASSTERFEHAKALYQQAEDVSGRARCLARLGEIALRRSDQETAAKRYEEALALFRWMGDVRGEADCIWRLGDNARMSDDPDDATERYGAALPLYRRVGDVRGEANCIHGMAGIALMRDEYDDATERYGAALLLYRRVGDVRGEANCISGMASIALMRDEYDDATERYGAALLLYRRVGDVRGEAYCISGTASVARMRAE